MTERTPVSEKREKFCLFCGKDMGALVDIKRRKFCSAVCVNASRHAIPDEERFWSKVGTRGDGCWEWIAARNDDGYGHFRTTQARYANAHRFSYGLHFGAIPAGMCVMHACDNRGCVNPLHLKLGSHLDNMRDCAAKKRSTWGARSGKAKLTEEQALEIRALKGQRTAAEIAPLYKVAKRTISDIWEGESWIHLQERA